MKKIAFFLLLMLILNNYKGFAQAIEFDQWWTTFGAGNAFQGFGNYPSGDNLFIDISVHYNERYYQIGYDDSGTPARSDKTMSVLHFDMGKTVISEFYMLNGFYGLGVMNYRYADTQQKLHNVITLGINLNAQLIFKPFDLFGFGLEPFTNLRVHHTVSGLRLTLMLGDGI